MDGFTRSGAVLEEPSRVDEALALIERARLLLTQATCRLGRSDGKAGTQIAHALATETGFAIERARDGIRSRRKQGAGEVFFSLSIHSTCTRDKAQAWSWCAFASHGTANGFAATYDAAMAAAVAATDEALEAV